MKPERLFLITATIGLIVSLLLVLAACTESSTYDYVASAMFPDGSMAMGGTGFLHVGIAGGLYAGWSLTLLQLARNKRLASEPELWSAIAGGLLLWFFLDSGASILTGGFYNVVGNSLYFGPMLWSTLALRTQASTKTNSKK